jgi:protein gp37
MGKDSKIVWTDHTWNPWWGCTKLPERRACDNCYAEAFAKRVGARCWGSSPRRIASPKTWTDPYAWDRAAAQAGKRVRVFCMSMGDFLEDRAELLEPRAKACRIIEETPHLEWLILTKRIDNTGLLPWAPGAFPSNMRMGITIEDQAAADRDVPRLLALDVANFLSIEPMLGGIDLKGWGHDTPTLPGDELKGISWEEYPWEDWIPEELRKAIQDFWRSSWGRGPWSWLRDHVHQHVPRTGARVVLAGDDRWLRTSKMAVAGVSGRYIHMWNNIGRVVDDDGRIHFTSGGRGSGWLSKWLNEDGSYSCRINHVIVGAESSPGHRLGRPLDLAWVCSLRDQCAYAGVPFMYKQGPVGGKLVELPELDGKVWDQIPGQVA